MKNRIIYFLFFLVMWMVSCKEKEKGQQIKSLDLGFEWKSDSVGCMGLRSGILQDSLTQIEFYKGSSKEEFVKTFGSPNLSQTDGKGQEIYYYFVACGMISEIDSLGERVDVLDKNASHLIVKIDTNEVVKDIFHVLP